MTKVGELPIQQSDGSWIYIDIHEPGTFDHDPLMVQLSDGSWGTPYLKPLGEADTPLLIQASDGTWYQVNEQGILVIEDWESGTYNSDRWNWTDSDFTGSSNITTTALYNSYALRLYQFRVTAAMPDYPDPAPYLPVEIGDTIEYHWQMPDASDIDSTQQYWFGYLLQTCPHHTTTAAGDQTRDNYYTAECITGSNDLFRISKRENGSTTHYVGDARATIDWQAGVWYRGVLDLWDNGDGHSIDVYRHTGGDSWTHEGSVVGPAPKWNSGGVLLRSGGDGGESLWDTIRKVP